MFSDQDKETDETRELERIEDKRRERRRVLEGRRRRAMTPPASERGRANGASITGTGRVFARACFLTSFMFTMIKSIIEETCITSSDMIRYEL